MPGKKWACVCFISLLVGMGLALLGCHTAVHPERSQGMRKPREFPEQKIAGEPGATAEYLAACRQEFRTGLRELFGDIADRVLAEKRALSPEITDRALAHYERYFQVTKGNTNLRREDVLEALRIGEKRQRALRAGLKRLADRFSKRGVRFQIAEGGHFENKILWEDGIEAGYRIVTDHEAELFAYPLMPMKTGEYMVPRAGPIAARLVYIDADQMLFLRHGEDPGEAFAAAAGEILGRSRDVSDAIDGVHLARLYDHYLEIVTIRQRSLAELDGLRSAFGALAVVGGDPHNFTAVILVGPELDLPILLRAEEAW
jgi:hypothetical protein